MDDDLRDHLDALVRSGFHSRDEILQAMADAVVDEEPAVSEAEIVAALDASIAAVRTESRSWPAVTDNDRLDEAFAALNASGVIARQDFACCMSCARAEIWDEVPDPDGWHGNVWFHRQDTERAIAGDGLYLGFGARDERSRLQRLLRAGGKSPGPDGVAVGRQVAEALSRAGLAVTWDGSADRRILIDPFVWRRPPPT